MGEVRAAAEAAGTGMPQTIGLCPVCKDEFYMPDAKAGEKCPYEDSWGDHDHRLVIYVLAEESGRPIPKGRAA